MVRWLVIAAGVTGCVLAGQVASAQDGAVAKVLGATYGAANTAEVELQVIRGSFASRAAVDLFDSFDPTARGEGTIALPNGVARITAGERAKATLTTRGPFPLGTAILAERGAFPNQAAVMKVVSGGSGQPARAAAAAPTRAALPPACPYTAAELKAALGLDVSEGAARPAAPFSGGTSIGCDYRSRSVGAPSLSLSMIVMDDPANADPAAYFKTLAGTLQAVPNDPDRAAWQSGQGDLTNATLHYVRRGVIVQTRVSVRPGDPSFQAMRDRLVKLRRVPD